MVDDKVLYRNRGNPAVTDPLTLVDNVDLKGLPAGGKGRNGVEKLRCKRDFGDQSEADLLHPGFKNQVKGDRLQQNVNEHHKQRQKQKSDFGASDSRNDSLKIVPQHDIHDEKTERRN